MSTHQNITPRTWRDFVLDCCNLKSIVLIMCGILFGFMLFMFALLWMANGAS